MPRGADPAAGPAAKDPTAVAAVVVDALWTWDTAIDNSPQDAWRRARPWLSVKAQVGADAQTSGWGAQWTDLAQARGWTSATAVAIPETEIPDTRTAAGRVFKVTVTPHSGSGASLTPFVLTCAVALVLEEGHWRVDQVVSSPVGAP